MNRKTTTLVLVALVAGLAAPGPSSATYDKRIYVPNGQSSSGTTRLAYRPRTMTPYAALKIRNIAWKAYGGRRAVGRGLTIGVLCKPGTTGRGCTHWVPTPFSVFRVRWACGKRIYTRMSIAGRVFALWTPYDRCTS
jgi:hypothetical protein